LRQQAVSAAPFDEPVSNGVVTGKAGQILMILLDPNLLSTMMRVAGEPAVERWFDSDCRNYSGRPPSQSLKSASV
jgi:hypothetical protein